MQGEKYTPNGKQINEYPAEFKKWVKTHKADIAKARSKGTEPYFIRNNSYAIDEILNPKQKVLTTLEKAKLRHEARTPEQIEAIKNRWAERKKERELTSVSKLMPDELKAGGEWLRGENYTYNKDFFDLINPNKPIPVHIHKKDGNNSYYSPMEEKVYLDNGGKRAEQSPYYRKSLIYHEFGHGIDWQRNLRYSQDIQDLRNKQIARLKKQVVQEYEKTYFDGVKMQYVTKKVKSRVMYAKVLSERLDRLYFKIRSMKDETFIKRGITKQDVIEQIAAVQDTLKSLITSVGWGHPTSYFKMKGYSEAEYIAHCFENTFIGNRIFQKYLPIEYAETIEFIKSLKKP